MFVHNFIERFFYSGHATKIMLFCAIWVTYVFCVTFAVCLFDREIRARRKGFFVYISTFCILLVCGSAWLDFITAKSFALFGEVAISFGCAILYFLEYTLLVIQSKIRVKGDKWQIQGENSAAKNMQGQVQGENFAAKNVQGQVQGENFAAKNVHGQVENSLYSSCIKDPKTPQKRVIKAGIVEVPLRKTEKTIMQRHNERLSENYLKGCIDSLKGKNLSPSDEEILRRIEDRLTFPIKCEGESERRELNENCGRLITLLAKYPK